jgi:hypothetical protein
MEKMTYSHLGCNTNFKNKLKIRKWIKKFIMRLIITYRIVDTSVIENEIMSSVNYKQ